MTLDIGVGDMVKYEANGVKVMIYARKIYPSNMAGDTEGRYDRIQDGNVYCWRYQVVRIVHTAAELENKVKG